MTHLSSILQAVFCILCLTCSGNLQGCNAFQLSMMAINSHYLNHMQQKMKAKMTQSVTREHIVKKVMVATVAEALEKQQDQQWQKLKTRYVDPSTVQPNDLLINIFLRRKQLGHWYFYKQYCLPNGLSLHNRLLGGGVDSDLAQESIATFMEQELFSSTKPSSSSSSKPSSTPSNTIIRGMGLAPIYQDIQTNVGHLRKVKPHNLEFSFQVQHQAPSTSTSTPQSADAVDTTTNVFYPIADQQALIAKARLNQQIVGFCNSASLLTSSMLPRGSSSVPLPTATDSDKHQEVDEYLQRVAKDLNGNHHDLSLLIATDGSAYWDVEQHICAGVGVCMHLLPSQQMTWSGVHDAEGDKKLFGKETHAPDVANERMLSMALTSGVKSELINSALDSELLAFLIGTSFVGNTILPRLQKHGLHVKQIQLVSDSKSLLHILRRDNENDAVDGEGVEMNLKQAAIKTLQQLRSKHIDMEINTNWHYGHPERIESNPERWELLDRMLWNADLLASATRKVDTKNPFFGSVLPSLDLKSILSE